MSQRTFPVGITSVPLVVTVNNNGPVTGLTVDARIIVPWLSLEFDFSTNTFVAAGTAVTDQLTLTESVTQPGVYFGLWTTTAVVTDSQTVVIYESTAATVFITDDQVDFQTAGAGTTSIANGFIETAYDRTSNTFTIIGGVKDAESGLLSSTAGSFTIKDELGTTLLSKATTSTTGIHRAVFPNAQLPPNRTFIVEGSFTVGPSTFNTIDTMAAIGVDE